MKIFSLIKKGLLGLGIMCVVSLQAQFPQFKEVTPEQTPMIFRGSAIWGDYDNDGRLEALALGRELPSWSVKGFVLKPNDLGNLEWLGDLSAIGLPTYDVNTDEVYNVILQWIDYDNDGLIDLLLMGNVYDENRPNPGSHNPDVSDNSYALILDLYKNTGSGFIKVPNTGLEGLYVEEESNYASVISIGDYDNDGYMDIIATGRREGVRRVDLYRNSAGTGEFILQKSPVKTIDDKLIAFQSQNAGSAIFADFNKDGKLDIIVNGWNNEINNALLMMYLNNGDGTFKDNLMGSDVKDAGSKSQIGVADINSDGYLDFVLSGEYLAGKDDWRKSSSIYYFDKEEFGYASFQYVAGSTIGLGSFQKSSIDFTDFNNDGKLDFVMAGEVGSAIPRTSIFLQEDNGAFNSLDGDDLVGSVRSGAIVTLADYNNDGHMDVMSMGYNNMVTGGRQGLHFGVFENQGNLKKNTHPTAPTNLKSEENNGVITFSWDAGSDLETPESALRYNFYLIKPNNEIYSLIPVDITTGYLKTTNHTTSLGTKFYSMTLSTGDYEWGVQTIDQSKMSSPFVSNIVSKVDDEYSVKAYASVINDRLFITTSEKTSVTVLDVNGYVLINQSVDSDSFISSEKQLTKGVYILKIQVGNKSKSVKILL